MKTTHFIVCAIGALLLSVATAGAQGKYKSVVLTIDHNDGRYAKTDTVKVWAERLEDDGEAVNLFVMENGEWTVKRQPLELSKGEKTLVFTKLYEEPTAVMLQVKPASDSKIFSGVGLIVAPEEFRPGFEEPEDFVTFWQDQVKKLRKAKIKAKLRPVEFPEKQKKYEGKIEAYDLEINMPSGNPVRAYIAWPAGADSKSCGILINPHGAGVRSSNLGNAIWKAKAYNCIAVDINAHGILNGQPKEFYDDLNKGELKDYRYTYAERKEDSYFRLMYLRLQRLLDYLCTLPQWDGQRVAVDGGSQGGGQAAAIAGLDPRVGFASVIVPALTDMGGTEAGHRGGWPNRGKFKEERDGNYKLALPYYDGANFLKHYNGILIIEGGMLDTTCAPECVYSAFNVAVSPNKVIYTNRYREHGEKTLWDENRKEWKETIGDARRDALKNYLNPSE